MSPIVGDALVADEGATFEITVYLARRNETRQDLFPQANEAQEHRIPFEASASVRRMLSNHVPEAIYYFANVLAGTLPAHSRTPPSRFCPQIINGVRGGG
jgi:hypothetical protein